MVESFIPEGTNIICTNMTGGVPMQIMQQRPMAYTVHDAKNKPLLNIDDRKLSGPFSCVVPGMYWGGLEALCLGIAVAALAVAVVATGGLALVAIGVGLAACTVGIGAGVTALCQIAHACDATLSSQWQLHHHSVTIEGYEKYALLNRSWLLCNKGGVLNLIMNPAIAMSAASEISDRNLKQFYMQMGSQFAMGLIGGMGGALGGGVGLAVSSVIAIPAYFWGEDEDNDLEKNNLLSNAWENVYQEAAAETAETILDPAVIKGSGRLAHGAAVYARGAVTGSTSDSLEGALRIALAQRSLKDIFSWKNMRGGVYCFLANVVIGVGSDLYENIQEDMAIEASRVADKIDAGAGNAISVVAVNVI